MTPEQLNQKRRRKFLKRRARLLSWPSNRRILARTKGLKGGWGRDDRLHKFFFPTTVTKHSNVLVPKR